MQQEIDEKELQDFKDACASPQSDGVAIAADILEAAQADVKEQFKEAFIELKEALEVTAPSLLLSLPLSLSLSPSLSSPSTQQSGSSLGKLAPALSLCYGAPIKTRQEKEGEPSFYHCSKFRTKNPTNLSTKTRL